MRLHRFYIGNSFEPNREVEIADENFVHQLTSVLRLDEGSALILLDGKGREAEGAIVKASKKTVRVRIGPAVEVEREAARNVTLCCAILRRENFEWVVQKATEVGVRRIIPLLTERTVKTSLNLERARRIATEALEQSGRGTLPIIDEPMTFAEAAAAMDKQQSLFFHFGGKADWETTRTVKDCVCWIGPEGGWSDDEAGAAAKQGWTIASLGPLTLRAETAAVVATYLATR